MGIVDRLSAALTGSPTTKALASRSHADRLAALDARKKEIDAHHEALKNEHTRRMTEAAEEAAAETARAEKIAADKADELSRQLGRECRSRIDPLVAEFVHGRDASGAAVPPRETVVKLATAWKELAARMKDETGDDLDERLLGYAFLDQHGDGAADRAASFERFWIDAPSQAAHQATLALLMKSVPEIDRALRHLEEVTARYAAQTPASLEISKERCALVRVHGARKMAHRAMRDHEEGTEAARRAGHRAVADAAGRALAANASLGRSPRRFADAPTADLSGETAFLPKA